MDFLAHLSTRPLLASEVDTNLFVNRERELSRLETAVNGTLNALIIGGRGSGKTSLLHQLERRFDGHPEVELLFVEGLRQAERPSKVLSLLAYARGRAVDRETELIEREIREQADSWIERKPASETEETLQMLSILESRLSGWPQRTVFVLDELPKPALAYSLFGRLRDELWRLPASWVVAATPQDAANYLRPPANDFFEVRVELDALEEDDRLELLRRRVDTSAVDEEDLHAIAASSTGEPRDLINLAREVFVLGERSDAIAARREERRGRAREFGEAALKVLDYIETNGPTSASDSDLQSTFGWTRPRATQLLKRLESAGLVEPIAEPTGSGRRKLYRVKE